MKQLRTLIILVIVFGGLLGYLYFVDAKRPVGDVEEKPEVFDVDADAIQALRIRSRSGETTELTKTDGTWRITSPIEAPADASTVGSITSNLAALSIQRVVDENPTDLGRYGLAEPTLEVAFRTKADEPYKVLQLGDKTAAGADMYAKRGGENQVFLVYNYIESSFDHGTFDLRDKRILTFDRDKVDRIEVRHGGSTIVLTKQDGEWRLAEPIQVRADYSAAEGLLSRLASLQMREIVDENVQERDFAKFGLRNPSTQVTLSSGSSQAALVVGSKTGDDLVHVRDLSRPAVFTTGSDILTELQKTAADYRRKDVFEFRTYNVDRLEIARGSETLVFERQRGKGKDGADAWRNVTADREVDAAKFESFLSRLTALRAGSFVDKPAGASPDVVVKTTFDDGKRNEEVRITRAGGQVHAVRGDEPGAAVVEASELDEVLKQLDELVKA
ncbi:MAG TPA: DUF4340 domain-containing protein [Vicinamibacterales bacterium]